MEINLKMKLIGDMQDVICFRLRELFLMIPYGQRFAPRCVVRRLVLGTGNEPDRSVWLSMGWSP
jgi:hypothetical protein